MMAAILSGGELPSLIVPGKNKYLYIIVFAGLHGIGCFAIEMPSVMQNWLKKISDGQGYR